jgi:hypothetical protein
MVTESGTFDTQVNIRSVVCNEVERLFDEQAHLLGSYVWLNAKGLHQARVEIR